MKEQTAKEEIEKLRIKDIANARDEPLIICYTNELINLFQKLQKQHEAKIKEIQRLIIRFRKYSPTIFDDLLEEFDKVVRDLR